MKKALRIAKYTLLSIASVIVTVVLVSFVWLQFYYEIDNPTILADVTDIVTECNDDYYAAYSSNATKGIILYQGAKVDYLAYGPLVNEIASRGYFCAVIDSPFNMALLNNGIPLEIMKSYPTINSWYIGGHSLGGVMACRILNEHPDFFDGVILLASYSDVDISNYDIEVISIYGSEDEVLSSHFYESGKKKLPSIKEFVIEGGNHAWFGNYGEQSGDGKATITPKEQQISTADIIAKTIG